MGHVATSGLLYVLDPSDGSLCIMIDSKIENAQCRIVGSSYWTSETLRYITQ